MLKCEKELSEYVAFTVDGVLTGLITIISVIQICFASTFVIKQNFWIQSLARQDDLTVALRLLMWAT